MLHVDAGGHLSDLKQTTGTVRVIPPDGKGVQSPCNGASVILYEGDDSYTDFLRYGGRVLEQLLTLETQGVTLTDGRHVKVKVLIGGDMLWLNEEFGLSTCSAKNPCIYCLIKLSNPDDDTPGARSVARAIRTSHAIIPGHFEDYICDCCGKRVTEDARWGPPDATSGLSKDSLDKKRREWQQRHDSQMFSRHPLGWFLPLIRRIPDTLHALLRVTGALFWHTAQKIAIDKKQV